MAAHGGGGESAVFPFVIVKCAFHDRWRKVNLWPYLSMFGQNTAFVVIDLNNDLLIDHRGLMKWREYIYFLSS